MMNSEFEISNEMQLDHNNLRSSKLNPTNLNSYLKTNDQQLVLNLQKIWTNEKFSKELLKYEEELFSEVTTIVERKEKELASLSNSKNALLKDFAEIIELDIDRIKFLAKDYLRIRLSKIDKYIYLIIKNDLGHLLSRTEYDFAVDLYKLKKNYFYEGINKRLPDLFNDFKNYPQNDNMIVAPPFNAYVCFKSLTFEPISINMKDIWEESEETLVVNREDVYCLPFNMIKDKLEEKKVCLL